MFTVIRRHDVGDGTVPAGTAATVDELHELLREVRCPSIYAITGSKRTVRLDLAAPIGDDRAFVEQLALAANGIGPGELVSQ